MLDKIWNIGILIGIVLYIPQIITILWPISHMLTISSVCWALCTGLIMVEQLTGENITRNNE